MDFINFYIDGIDMKQDFNIIRTSGGEGFSTQLSPSFSIETLNAGGAKSDFLYTGREYSSTSKEIKFATDGISEIELKNLMVLLSKDGVHKLQFDECPILIQDIVFAQPPTFDFNVFLDKGERVYKGTGIISYNIISRYRYYNSTIEVPNKNSKNETIQMVINSPNFDEWSAAYGQWDKDREGNIKNKDNVNKSFTIGNTSVYNCGDFPTDFILKGTSSGQNNSSNSNDTNDIIISIGGQSVIIKEVPFNVTITINGEKQYVTVTDKNGKTDFASFEGRIPQIPFSKRIDKDKDTKEIKEIYIPVEINTTNLSEIKSIDYKILYI